MTPEWIEAIKRLTAGLGPSTNKNICTPDQDKPEVLEHFWEWESDGTVWLEVRMDSTPTCADELFDVSMTREIVGISVGFYWEMDNGIGPGQAWLQLWYTPQEDRYHTQWDICGIPTQPQVDFGLPDLMPLWPYPHGQRNLSAEDARRFLEAMIRWFTALPQHAEPTATP